MENEMRAFEAFLDSQETNTPQPPKKPSTSLFMALALTLLVSCGKKVEKVVGANGLDGQSCYSETVQGGVNVICGESINFIPNGQDGTNGVDGQDGIDGQDGTFNGYLEYVEVCPQVAGQYKETLLNLDGTFLAFLASSNYKKERLVILPENQLFKTTDGRNVSFSIVNGQIVCL